MSMSAVAEFCITMTICRHFVDVSQNGGMLGALESPCMGRFTTRGEV